MIVKNKSIVKVKIGVGKVCLVEYGEKTEKEQVALIVMQMMDHG